MFSLFVNLFLLLVVVICFISLLYTFLRDLMDAKKEGYTKFSNVHSIPKVIWTYQSTPKSEEMEEHVKLCIESWKFHNPSYDVIVMDRENVSSYVDMDIYAFDQIEDNVRANDYMRLFLLQKHGGIWIDSTVLCTQPLDRLIDNDNSKDFIGFYTGSFRNNRFPVIEKWFMACPADSELMFKVKNEFMRINDFALVEQYVKDVKESGVKIQEIPFPEYLAMHIAFQKILQTSDPYDINILDARGENGPFFYLYQNDWDSKKALNMLCEDNTLKTPLIMLREDEEVILKEEGIASIKCLQEFI